MKATRLLLTVLAVAVVSACSSANLTGPSPIEAQGPNHGMFGSGN